MEDECKPLNMSVDKGAPPLTSHPSACTGYQATSLDNWGRVVMKMSKIFSVLTLLIMSQLSYKADCDECCNK